MTRCCPELVARMITDHSGVADAQRRDSDARQRVVAGAPGPVTGVGCDSATVLTVTHLQC